MWSNLGWSVALLVISSGCIPTGRIVHYQVSDQFTPFEVETIVESAEFWNEVSREHTDVGDVLIFDGIRQDSDGFDMDDLADDATVVHKAYYDSEIWNRLEAKVNLEGPGRLLGYSFVTDIAIATDALSTKYPLDLIATHEFGHMIGVDHIPNSGHLMSPVPSKEFTTIDLKAFCTVFRCDR